MDNNINKNNENHLSNGWIMEIAPISAKLTLVSDLISEQEDNMISSMQNYVDIAKFRKIELELQEAKEKLKEADLVKLDLIQNIGHSINTPCKGAVSAGLVLYEAENNPNKKESLATIINCAKELLDYSNGMIDFLKSHVMLTPVVVKKFDLRKLVTQSIAKAKPAASHKGLKLVCNFQNDIANTVIGDNYRLQAILDQLINNAIKFTEKGNVMVTVNMFIAKTQEKDKKDNREVIFQFIVHDTGVGIPKEEQQYIYEELTKAESRIKYRGLGLGLAFVKQFIKDLHADIDIRSIEGKGTTFVFDVPVKLPLLEGIIYNEL